MTTEQNSEPQKSRLGDLLREARESGNMSARQVTDAAGVAHSHLGRIERGETIPSERTIRRLADALSYNPDPVLIVAGHITGQDARQVLTRLIDAEQTTTFVMWEELIGYTHEQAAALVKNPAVSDEDLVDLAYALALWGLGPDEQQAERALVNDAAPLLAVWSRLSDRADKDRVLAFARSVLELREIEQELDKEVAATGQPRVPFSTDDLRRRGFEGFVPLSEARGSASPLPKTPGAYAVLRATPDAPRFLERSVGGPYRGELPALVSELAARWNEGASLVYLGKTDRPLAKRVRELARYGAGEKEAHAGGRYMWQLADHADLLVAWIVSDEPAALEADLVAEFEAAYDQLPFANINRPKRASR